MPLTLGSDIFGDYVPPRDAFVVRRLRDAGFVLVGKTNLPEFGIVPVTESRRHGPARNPWDTERTPGARPVVPPRPWRPAWCRSRTAATAAALSGSPRRAAASWG